MSMWPETLWAHQLFSRSSIFSGLVSFNELSSSSRPRMTAATVKPPARFGHRSQAHIPFSSRESSGRRYPAGSWPASLHWKEIKIENNPLESLDTFLDICDTLSLSCNWTNESRCGGPVFGRDHSWPRCPGFYSHIFQTQKSDTVFRKMFFKKNYSLRNRRCPVASGQPIDAYPARILSVRAFLTQTY